MIDEDRQRAGVLGNPADDLAQVPGLLAGQAGGGLVKQDQLRPADDGAGDLEQAALASFTQNEIAAAEYALDHDPVRGYQGFQDFRPVRYQAPIIPGCPDDEIDVSEGGLEVRMRVIDRVQGALIAEVLALLCQGRAKGLTPHQGASTLGEIGNLYAVPVPGGPK